ncbi:class I SAM-dependent methyltransferase [Halosimplex halobium]|uniref:class I SAM-dependent methyltransferase n=1 Tax=Halosimplex halobium TaxID=3396618 RepID=UPI003F552CC4
MRTAELATEGIKNPIRAVRYVLRQCYRKYIGRVLKKWARNHHVRAQDYLREADEALWLETMSYLDKLESDLQTEYGNEVYTSDLHDRIEEGAGGAAHDILYFYTRYLEPTTVLETGVAAGWSSRVITDGLYKNSEGKLYSNDLPYPESALRPSEDQIGILVDDEKRDIWELSIGPDRENLPEIISSVDSIDLFHYDSDKSYGGREFALSIVRSKLHENSVIIMDDIFDNMFFKEFVESRDVDYAIIQSARKEKSVGVIRGVW